MNVGDREENGKKYLQQYGVTDNSVSNLNLFLQGYCVGTRGIADVARGLARNWSLTSVELRKQEIGPDGATCLGECLRHNRYIRYLGLGRNKLGNVGTALIADGMAGNTTVQYLDLEWNEIRDDGALSLGVMLARNNTLRSLILERNKIKGEGCVGLAQGLARNGVLRYLNIGFNKVSNVGAAALASVVGESESLITLCVYSNEIRTEGGVALIRALRVNDSLQSLGFQNNPLQQAGGLLGECLKDNHSIRDVNLQNTQLDAPSAAVLGEGLLSNQSLVSLDVSGNPLGHQGVCSLLTGIKGKPALRYLDLSNTGLAPGPSLDDVCEVLELGGNLEVLLLEGNHLGKRGVITLCRRLGTNHVLHSLNLDNTGMGQEGAAALAIVLQKKSRWISLSVSGNNVGNEGVKNLCAGLRSFNTLTELDMSENNASGLCEDSLYSVLDANPRLPFIRLQGNDLATHLPGGVLTRAYAEEMSGLAAALAADAAQGGHSRPNLGVLPQLSSPLASAAILPPAQQYQRLGVKRAAGGPIALLPPPRTPSPAPQSLGPGFTAAAPLPAVPRPTSTTPPALKGGLSSSLSTRPTPLASVRVSPVPSAALKSITTRDPLRPMEGNVGGLLVTDEQLRKKFNELDTHATGWLDKAAFLQHYKQMDNFGVPVSEKNVDEVLGKSWFAQDGKITCDQFCIIMLGLVGR